MGTPNARAISMMAVLLLVVGVTDAAGELLLSKQLQLDYRFPDQDTVLTSDEFTVGDGVELLGAGGGIFDVDVADDSVSFPFTEFANGTFSGPAQGISFNGPVLIDFTGTIDPFQQVTIHPSTNLAGFGPSSVFFDSDTIFVNFAGLTFTPDSLARLEISSVAPVPEPGTMVLSAIGFLVSLAAGWTQGRKKGPSRASPWAF
jgi:hypothetical protein